MENKLEIRHKRSNAFKSALGYILLRISLFNALLIGLAVISPGDQTNRIIAVSYILLTVGFVSVPFLRQLAGRTLRNELIALHLGITFFMVYRTGAINSDLYPVLFLPVFAAAISCRYPGIILWSTLLSLGFLGTGIVSGNIPIITFLIKAAYLYIAGIFGGFLVHHTYTVTEEVSRTLARWNMDLERLNSFSLEVTASSTLGEIFEQTLKIVRRGDSDSMAAIMLFDEEGQLKIFDAVGWEPEWIEKYRQNPLGRNSLSLAPILVFKKPLLCSNIKKHNELTKLFQGIAVQSLFAFPLVVDNDVAGALVLNGAEPRELPEKEVQILTNIVNQAGLAIQNVVKLKDEKDKAQTDGLTGVFNRRYFNETLDDLVYQAQQKEEPLSLILMDIDNFKKYNDSFGHPAGDQLLKKVSATVVRVVDEDGIVARYGGEEFAVILENTAHSDALGLAEEIRSHIENMVDFTLKTRVTISLGVSTLPNYAKDRVSLLESADKSLYEAKRAGKNRVCSGYR